MKLVTINNVPGGSAGALLGSGEIVNLALAARPGTLETWMPTTVRGILEAGRAGMDLVRGIVSRHEALAPADREGLLAQGILMPPGTPLLAPVPQPRLLIAAGLAFHQHLKEMSGTPVPSKPTAFMKSVNSITGPGAAVAIPKQAPSHVDFEGELAVVFGEHCYQATPDEAQRCIAGYTAANDISARDWVFDVFGAKEVWEARQTWEVNIMGKQLPGFTPLGPALVTADEFADITTARLQTRLNGQTMQSVTFDDLIFTINQTISYLSQWYAFAPGDVLLTGTPAGVGVGRKPAVYMQAGDVVEVEIDGIGILRNVLVDA
ncbi:fumarylacetoacetate hydrolase family protein [Pigmentiphaga litoralis]|uniref:2-keto-4-pentenoate hydratase/2-oxohepta-3-ene-1,7-dioic acid hydratase in catechol pathway n=1 Tax=Pigmentiphaga litoralis TaxID=516702 RepID=A0A7Y9ITM4_9BURK|nr:fumarylacetoacetate hydrolase family protein [Pigmentiphaga litoralis]NYE23549.1 2-keto-4-pentenoate hydratase/2-oxohepta-3-ene-1,7-dioic acid hydratase in catechol pathway [Pigmentiphaga litoralis]NYE82837.1 2-keto-4-pentenoate hydratase/2-oxohepta-3-ene-1,7-dioic acid hydratase in catechol pathway [Pigmentiphaga litoralis]